MKVDKVTERATKGEVDYVQSETWPYNWSIRSRDADHDIASGGLGHAFDNNSLADAMNQFPSENAEIVASAALLAHWWNHGPKLLDALKEIKAKGDESYNHDDPEDLNQYLDDVYDIARDAIKAAESVAGEGEGC